MNIELFVKEMNGSHADAVLEKHIVRKYVPFEEKLAQAQRIVDASCYKEIEGKRLLWMNTPMRVYLQTIALISMYTDILDGNAEKNLVAYNALNENGLIDKIFEKIPDDGKIEFDLMVSSMVDDACDNETNTVNIIERKMVALEKFFDTAVNNIPIEDIIKSLRGGSIDEEESISTSEINRTA